MKKGKTNTSDVCASNIIKFDAWWHIMDKYRLEGETFVIDDYDKLPAFSSFLPGLAGVKGIPMWTFYTNRGQGMNSFGIDNKGIDNL